MNGFHDIEPWSGRHSGFSLFEVLIAIVVLSIGLIGVAGMQAAGLISNQSAYHKSQATVLAYDIADRMRANKEAVNFYLTSYKTLEEATTIGPKRSCVINSGECPASVMAQNDLFEWGAALKAALPSAAGTITVAGATYTVTVSWDDDRDGAIDGNDPSFQVSFQP